MNLTGETNSFIMRSYWEITNAVRQQQYTYMLFFVRSSCSFWFCSVIENNLLSEPTLQQIQREVVFGRQIDPLAEATESIFNGFHILYQNIKLSDNHDHANLNVTLDTNRVELLQALSDYNCTDPTRRP